MSAEIPTLDRAGVEFMELIREIVRQEIRRENQRGRQAVLPDEPPLTLREAAALINQSPRTLRQWASVKRVRSERSPGGHLRFKRAELMEDVFGKE